MKELWNTAGLQWTCAHTASPAELMGLTAFWFFGVAAIVTQTPEVIDFKTNRVRTIATDESPVFVRDHRSPSSADRAIWASNHKGRVGLNRLHLRMRWCMSDAKSVLVLKLWQLYRLRAGRYRRLSRDFGSSAKGSAACGAVLW
jgi:hypothetical protein